ncbi:MAG: DUF2914 domain-containing protein [Proteobacteria bacterium]|nr:DUF2914 domain-containing protein [Pseudomonadota bacterium]MBU1688958.1 DUF2914 domain-containing protein [Pseudomonadota bacterium]
MKTPTILLSCLLLIQVFSFSSASTAGAEESASMTINRFAICQSVVNREPMGTSTTFDDSTREVFAFLEARNISTDLSVSFVWFYQDMEISRYPLPIHQGNRWRTYASKSIAGKTGSWRVEIQDGTNTVLAAQDFMVIGN